MTNILPDPNYPITDAGETNMAGNPGPGFESVKLASVQPIMSSRTNSGLSLTRAIAAHHWTIDISYNPMTREMFDPVYSFLLSRRGGLLPFYVSLPQYRTPKDALMVSNPTTSALVTAGSLTIPFSSAAGTPKPGDLFTVSDVGDSTHTKAYMVSWVDAGEIGLTSEVSKNITSGSTLTFINPLIRVLGKGQQEYNLGVNGLYAFSLKLEEAQI